MDRNFPRVAPDDYLAQAIPLLGQTSCVLVMDQDRLLGLLTRENLSEFMMLRRFGMTADTPA
jgi:predicted transcriptional regulator